MDTLSIRTNNRVEFVDISGQIRRWLKEQGVTAGVLTLYVPHTTAGITINEHADPDVATDIIMELNKVIPFEDGYRHLEGNAAAHIKASLVGSSVQVIVENGDLVLGTWQGIFFCEFDGPRQRKLHAQFTPAG
ncbi:MAG: secondary thiamine-phosphate synthase enzyme YjbQ [Candidatus Marinimicrobia bacterium]|nr:secondary thiamine-phosphate synthase enzyme YjbQ [Candidatus Neomarinimicrobiota bacterium]